MSYYTDELKRKSREIDLALGAASQEPVISEPVPPPPSAREDSEEQLYNVHKRSLPPGIDKIVLFNVTKQEYLDLSLNRVDKELMKDLKGQCSLAFDEEKKQWFYYDLVPVDATADQRSIYYNSGPITKEAESLEIISIDKWID